MSGGMHFGSIPLQIMITISKGRHWSTSLRSPQEWSLCNCWYHPRCKADPRCFSNYEWDDASIRLILLDDAWPMLECGRSVASYDAWDAQIFREHDSMNVCSFTLKRQGQNFANAISPFMMSLAIVQVVDGSSGDGLSTQEQYQGLHIFISGFSIYSLQGILESIHCQRPSSMLFLGCHTQSWILIEIFSGLPILRYCHYAAIVNTLLCVFLDALFIIPVQFSVDLYLTRSYIYLFTVGVTPEIFILLVMNKRRGSSRQ